MTLKSAKDFWNNVKSELSKQGLTQRELCVKCGFNEGSFKNRISRSTFPTIDEVYLISQMLNVSIDSLVGLEKPAIPPHILTIAKEVESLPQSYQQMLFEIVKIFKKNLPII